MSPKGTTHRLLAMPGGVVRGLFAQVGAIAWLLAIVGSLVILKICDVVVGVRASEDQEVQGLDLSMHGEEGYTLEG